MSEMTPEQLEQLRAKMRRTGNRAEDNPDQLPPWLPKEMPSPN